jgi:hypothetical protein
MNPPRPFLANLLLFSVARLVVSRRVIFSAARALISLVIFWAMVCQTMLPKPAPRLIVLRASDNLSLKQSSDGTKRRRAGALQGVDSSGAFLLVGAGVGGAVSFESAIMLFGPRRFERTNGAPNKYVEQFSLPSGVTSPLVLHIQNGEPTDQNASRARPSSA